VSIETAEEGAAVKEDATPVVDPEWVDCNGDAGRRDDADP
jgi:hypothetical protein